MGASTLSTYLNLYFSRQAAQDTTVAGVPIPEGDRVVLSYVSANRDERAFDDPDALDVTRNPNDHVAFGAGGPHFCLGASLARMEGQSALPRLVRRFPRMQPAYDEPAWMDRMFLRGVETLPVALQG